MEKEWSPQRVGALESTAFGRAVPSVDDTRGNAEALLQMKETGLKISYS